MRTRSPRDGQLRVQPESRDRDKIDASRTTRRSRDTRTYSSRHFATTCLQLVVSAWTEPHLHLPRFQPFVRQSVVGVHLADRPQDADSTAYTWILNTVERVVTTCMRPGVPWSWREMTRSRVSPNPSSMTSTETFWFTFAPKWTMSTSERVATAYSRGLGTLRAETFHGRRRQASDSWTSRSIHLTCSRKLAMSSS